MRLGLSVVVVVVTLGAAVVVGAQPQGSLTKPDLPKIPLPPATSPGAAYKLDHSGFVPLGTVALARRIRAFGFAALYEAVWVKSDVRVTVTLYLFRKPSRAAAALSFFRRSGLTHPLNRGDRVFGVHGFGPGAFGFIGSRGGGYDAGAIWRDRNLVLLDLIQRGAKTHLERDLRVYTGTLDRRAKALASSGG